MPRFDPRLGIERYSEEFLEQVRAKIKRKRLRRRRAAKRKAHRESRRGMVHPTMDLPLCFIKYSYYWETIVDITLRTSSSQTKQYHPVKYFRRLSERILDRTNNGIIRVEREDIEQEMYLIWVKVFNSYSKTKREKKHRLKYHLLRNTLRTLPHKLWRYSQVPTELDNESVAEPPIMTIEHLVKPGDHPLSKITSRDRLVLYLFQYYPKEYTKVSGMLRTEPKSLRYMVNGLSQYIQKEF